MFLFSHFDLFYFFAQLNFWQKKVFQKLFFSVFLQFRIHFLIPSDTNFIINICWSLVISAWGNFPKLVEISKKKRSLEFHCPKHGQIILKLNNLASWNIEFYKFGWNNQSLCFSKIFIVSFFPVNGHCVLVVKQNYGSEIRP